MMRHLVVLYLFLASVIVLGPNPLWMLPLLLVSASYLTGNRYLGVVGVLAFFTITLGRMPAGSLSDLSDLSVTVVGIVLPGILALDMALSERPYKVERPGWGVVATTSLLVVAMIASMVAVSRLLRIGVYLDSDPMLQVFVVVSLALLFTGPVLLTRGAPGKGQS